MIVMEAQALEIKLNLEYPENEAESRLQRGSSSSLMANGQESFRETHPNHR